MKKIITCIALASILLSACSDSEPELSESESELSEDERLTENFASDIKIGSERDLSGNSLSAETSRCMAEATIPFMNKELLSEKVGSSAVYQIDDLALYDNDQEKSDDSLAARLRCLTDEEFTKQIESEFQLNFDIDGSCMAEKIVDGNTYADIFQSPDGGEAQFTAFAQECQTGIGSIRQQQEAGDLVVE